jgi:DNA-directed RNA polymerase specialized sigma24 family protein
MSHIVLADPSDISARFSNKDRLGHDGSEIDFEAMIEENLGPAPEEQLVDEEGPPQLKLDFSAIEGYLDRIPPREADLITLYYRDRMKQEQIAKLFSITQAAVSYRLHRGIKRIQFLRTIDPALERDQFERDLAPKFSDQDREILWRMYETTCQSEIAKQMGLTQGRVRHRFFRSLERIKKLIIDEGREVEVELQMRQGGSALTDEVIEEQVNEAIVNSRYAKYWTVFFAISDKHFNILHEVSLPQFQDRGDAQILTID